MACRCISLSSSVKGVTATDDGCAEDEVEEVNEPMKLVMLALPVRPKENMDESLLDFDGALPSRQNLKWDNMCESVYSLVEETNE
jgi:hypothetical protein